MSEFREALRAWVAARHEGIEPSAIADHTPLVEHGYLRSLDLPELLLLLEEMAGRPLDPSRIEAGSFSDLDRICTTFLAGGET